MAKKKVVRRRGKSKAKNKGYFRKEHQEAIVQFCKSDCPQEKDRLYTDIIREALEKLSENLITYSHSKVATKRIVLNIVIARFLSVL